MAAVPPLAAADPEGRCAAVLLRAEGGTRLALLPAVEGDMVGHRHFKPVLEAMVSSAPLAFKTSQS